MIEHCVKISSDRNCDIQGDPSPQDLGWVELSWLVGRISRYLLPKQDAMMDTLTFDQLSLFLDVMGHPVLSFFLHEVQGDPGGHGLDFVDSKSEVTFSCKFIL